MKKTLLTIITTALVTCLLTNTVRDIKHTKAHGGVERKVQTVLDIAENYSIYEIDEEKMGDAAIEAMLGCIDDDYARYFTKEDYANFGDGLNESYLGIGITLSADREKDKVVVVSAVEGGAAEQQGILSGDYIIAVDGVSYTAEEMSKLVSAIKGKNTDAPEGSTVRLTIERGDSIFDITVPRTVISVETVSSKLLGDGIGYIRINQFNGKNENIEGSKDTYEKFVEHMEGLESQNIKSLVIDLRNNPGGNLSVVTKIADYLLPSGVITYTEDKRGEKKYYNSEEDAVDLPMVVLVNGGSASASEVLSGALKDFKAATLVGEKTFGKGVVQSVLPMYDGSGVIITSSKYYTPSGVCIHGTGIEPDVFVELVEEKSVSKLSYKEDVQLQKAVEILSK